MISTKQVHILNETRGSTLEVVTSRMKLRRPTVRFVLVSATVPNIRDVADWIGSGAGKQEPAMVFEV
jgi:ATP-dependent DNA helicase HFM1/MER3